MRCIVFLNQRSISHRKLLEPTTIISRQQIPFVFRNQHPLIETGTALLAHYQILDSGSICQINLLQATTVVINEFCLLIWRQLDCLNPTRGNYTKFLDTLVFRAEE